jgi:acetate kinase
MAQALEHESGLLGLAGTGDMRELDARDDEQARLALDVHLHRLCAGIGAMAAALGGLDVLAFTGGVGENDAALRERVGERLAFLGIVIEDSRNRDAAAGDRDVSAPEARARTLVLRAREDLEIARQVRAVLGAATPR